MSASKTHPSELQEQAPSSAPSENGASAERERLLLRVARSFKENEQLFHWTVQGFKRLQRFGISISPNHFYWPVPDVKQLESRPWIQSGLCGIDLGMERQLEFLEKIVPQYQAEFRFADKRNGVAAYHYNNGFFETVDAEIAYSMVRHFQPRRIIEVGAGYSSLLFMSALRANYEQGGNSGELLTIDPDSHKLNVPPGSSFTLIPKPVQQVDLSLFSALGENDILFLDSSHVVGVGSDVVYEYLEILPRLNRGVLVHAHDIFLPADYPREAVLDRLCFWSEQYLLQAFLTFNREFEVLWGSSAMQLFQRDALDRAFPRWKSSYPSMPLAARRFVPSIDNERVWPSSFWFRRK